MGVFPTTNHQKEIMASTVAVIRYTKDDDTMKIMGTHENAILAGYQWDELDQARIAAGTKMDSEYYMIRTIDHPHTLRAFAESNRSL